MPRQTSPKLFTLGLLAALASAVPTGAQPPFQPGEIPVGPPPSQVLPLPREATPGLPPIVVPARPLVEKPISVYEFARMVDPKPGHYEVLFCHPYTGEPVRVCFDLPAGCPKVCVDKRLLFYVLEFDYGHCEVEVKFGCKGRVRVRY